MAVIKHVLDSDPDVLKAAFADLGLKELPGKKHNPRVLEMFKDSGNAWVKDDETAWCAAAVGSWLKKAGLPGTGALSARSYCQWGKKTSNPKRGDIVVFTRGSGWQGHVALYLGEANGRVWHIGGNQSNAVTVTSTPRSKVLDFRTPVTALNSRTAHGVMTAGAGSVGMGLGAFGEQMQSSLDQASGVFHSLGELSPWFMLIGGLLTIAGIVWMGYARYSDWKEKAR
jgi:uncharacterized protein (TIGR02594 family)